MKRSGKIQVLSHGENHLKIPEVLTQGLPIEEGALLHSIALEPLREDNRKVDGSDSIIDLKPACSIVASPLPVSSWHSVVRASVSIGPRPGALRAIFDALCKVGIVCHHIESANGLSFEHYQVRRKLDNRFNPIVSRHGGEALLIPAVRFWLEVPSVKKYEQLERLRNPAKPDDLAEQLVSVLHELINVGDGLSMDPGQDGGKGADGEVSRADEDDSSERGTSSVLTEEVRLKAVRLLQDLLRREIQGGQIDSGYRVAVEWISPMSTLNILGNLKIYDVLLDGPSAEPKDAGQEQADERELGQDGLAKATLAEYLRSRSRKKFIVQTDNEGGYFVDVRPWRNMLWDIKGAIPDRKKLEEPENAVVISHVDSDEQILGWQVYRSKKNCKSVIIAVELLSPAGIYVHSWWAWLFEQVSKAFGSILTAETGSRLDGNWTRLKSVLIFPLDPNAAVEEDGRYGEGHVKNFLDCIRGLQGREASQTTARNGRKPEDKEDGQADEKPIPKIGTSEWSKLQPMESLRHRLNFSRDSLACYAGLATRVTPDVEPRFQSTLHVNGIWDPKFGTRGRRYDGCEFQPNPFSFTRPLSKERFEDLYQSKVLQYPYASQQEVRDRFLRLDLASRIIRRLKAKENICLVGAHRSGKTTILELVENDLGGNGDQEDTPLAAPDAPAGTRTKSNSKSKPELRKRRLAVRVNAATVPPYAIIAEIYGAIALQMKSKKDRRKLKKWLAEVGDLLPRPARIKIGFMGASAEMQLKNGEPDAEESNDPKDPQTRVEELAWAEPELPSQQGAYLLRSLLDKLHGLLQTIEKIEFVVVLLDEVGKLGSWGRTEFLQVLRHAVESARYEKVRWLISTSRPVAQDPTLSPITNAFKEYRVGSLSRGECEGLLDRFISLPVVTNAKVVQPEGERSDEIMADNARAADSAVRLSPVLTYLARVFLVEVTARLPYFLQVSLYHLYDEVTEDRIPIANRRVCKDVLVDNAVKEIQAFVDYQWASVPTLLKDRIEAILNDTGMTPLEFADRFDCVEALESSNFGALEQASLQNLGLKGSEGAGKYVIAPLVGIYLLSSVGRASVGHLSGTGG